MQNDTGYHGMSKKALVTGIFGQDGSYLAELLYGKGYAIYGIERLPLSESAAKLRNHLAKKGIISELHECDLNEY